MSASIQPRSGLNSLKRSWSGSSHDLGDDGHDDDEVRVAPTKAQRKLDSEAAAAAAAAVRSSQTEYLEGWEPTPPERQQSQRRQMLNNIDANARSAHGEWRQTVSGRP